MKKTRVIAATLATTALLSMGALFGCASDQSQSEDQAGANFDSLSEYEKILQVNTLENLAGDNGTLACTVEMYGEEGTLEDEQAIQWTLTDGTPSIQWKDTIDGDTQLAMSEYSQDNCGAIYAIEGEDKSVSVIGENDMSDTIISEWSSLIEYEGTQSDVTTSDNQSTLVVTQEAADDEESYYVATYIYDTESYVLSSVETVDYEKGTDTVLDRVVVRDISTEATLDLGANPYETITNVDDNNACNLTVVVIPTTDERITSTYKVSRDATVDMLIFNDYDMYSDEAMTNLIEDIDVSGPEAIVYVKISDETDTVDDSDVDIEADEAGTEYVSEDGTVLTLGDDGNLYDESGNVVSLDDMAQDAATDDTESADSGDGQ